MEPKQDSPHSSPARQPKKRKRGAQPGNSNALKHGFYAQHFNQAEITRLERFHDGLADEINMLRLAMQRLVAMATEEETSVSEWKKTLQALGLASQRLAKLVQIQQELTGKQDLESDEFIASIREIMHQNGWNLS